MIFILDILQQDNRLHLVVDRMPELLFERSGDSLTAHDYPFSYQLVRGDVRKRSPLYFAEARLTDGSVLRDLGSWWVQSLPATRVVAIATPAQLKESYVFYPAHILSSVVDNYLAVDSINPNFYSWIT
jgi:hypothetical protein